MHFRGFWRIFSGFLGTGFPRNLRRFKRVAGLLQEVGGVFEGLEGIAGSFRVFIRFSKGIIFRGF